MAARSFFSTHMEESVIRPLAATLALIPNRHAWIWSERIELDEVDSESAIEITDPDAISYKCKLLVCDCTDLDKHVGWDKAFDAMKGKPWVPELGAGRRPLEMELSQSQLLFAPGELALTRAKKINKRNYRVVKQVLDACKKN